MSKDKDENSWGYGGVKRRDFQHTHDGPEEMPHKKKSKKPNRKRSRCDHEFELLEERTWYYRPGHGQRQLYFRCWRCYKKKYELTWIDESW